MNVKKFIIISAMLSVLVSARACKDPGPSDMMTLPVPTDLVLLYQEDEEFGACLLFTWSPVGEADHYYVSLNDAADSSMVAEVESVDETGVMFQGVEGGLNPAKFAPLQCAETYIDKSLGCEPLGVQPADIDAAIADSARLSFNVVLGKAGEVVGMKAE